jgi:hypothetical protein
VYARSTGNRELTFDFAEGLLEDNLLIVDRETSSVWSQLRGRAISGPLNGTPLEVVPSLQTTWSFWRSRHPATEVWVAREEGRSYFYRDRIPGTPRSQRSRADGPPPSGHDVSTLGLGLAFDEASLFLPFAELERSTLPLALTIGDQKTVVHFDRDALTAWAETPQGELLPSVLVYRFGWMRFHPDSEVFQPGQRD